MTRAKKMTRAEFERAFVGASVISDRPFALPNRELISTVIDVPAPPSVNSTRKVDWRNHSKVTTWMKAADSFMLQRNARGLKAQKIIGRYELLITISEAHTKIDLDNGLKVLIDYLRRIELVTNDSPKYLRRIVVEWGHAPVGCRVTVQELP